MFGNALGKFRLESMAEVVKMLKVRKIWIWPEVTLTQAIELKVKSALRKWVGCRAGEMA